MPEMYLFAYDGIVSGSAGMMEQGREDEVEVFPRPQDPDPAQTRTPDQIPGPRTQTTDPDYRPDPDQTQTPEPDPDQRPDPGPDQTPDNPDRQ
eukprot:gene19827-26513_t